MPIKKKPTVRGLQRALHTALNRVDQLQRNLKSGRAEYEGLRDAHDRCCKELAGAQDRLRTATDDAERRLSSEKASRMAETASLQRTIDVKHSEINRLRQVNLQPFRRKDLEQMTAEQVRSAVTESINEARRRGMVEAEGEVQRHLKLVRDTDIETLSAIIKNLSDKVAALTRQKAEEAAREAAPVPTEGPAQRLDKAVTEARSKCHCGGWLVRGQCVVHTQNWIGDDHCICGLTVRFCRSPARVQLNKQAGHVTTVHRKTVSEPALPLKWEQMTQRERDMAKEVAGHKSCSGPVKPATPPTDNWWRVQN